MQNLDFTKMMNKYPLLKTKDVSFLNKFFNREDIQKILNEIQVSRKKSLKNNLIIFLLILILFYVLSLYLFLFEEYLMPFLVALFLSIILFFIIYMFKQLLSKKKKTIKNSIIPEFVKSMWADIKYSEKWTYFKDFLKKLEHKWILEKYNRVDFIEDSIRYIIWDTKNSIEITWAEIKTSEKKTRRTKNGTHTYYVVSNHCYMMKVLFKNPRFTFKKPIKLLEDVSDNYVKKFFVVIWIQFTILFTILSSISWDENTDGYADDLLKLAYDNLSITITFLIWMFFVIWFVYTFMRWKKRVKLENIDFEKEFDVFSEDQIESRKLLTPSFMYRLVDFVNKINHRRIYEMYFHKNYFYLKFNILRTNSFINWRGFKNNNYMEFSKWKNVFKNLEDYVEFFLEIKNITALSKDLKLFYYDKWMMSKKVI